MLSLQPSVLILRSVFDMCGRFWPVYRFLRCQSILLYNLYRYLEYDCSTCNSRFTITPLLSAMVPLLQFLLCAGFDDECGSPGEVQPLDQSMPLGREFPSFHWDGWASHIPNVMEVLRSSVPRSLFPFSWIAIRCRQIMIQYAWYAKLCQNALCVYCIWL